TAPRPPAPDPPASAGPATASAAAALGAPTEENKPVIDCISPCGMLPKPWTACAGALTTSLSGPVKPDTIDIGCCTRELRLPVPSAGVDAVWPAPCPA